MREAFRYRPLREDELPLVYNSFLRSLQKCAPYNLITPSKFFASFHDLIDNWMKSGDVNAAVVDLDDGTSEVVGWAVGREGFVGYVYVKYRFRKMGIARTLVKKLVGDIGFSFEVCTPAGAGFIKRIGRGYPMWAVYRSPVMGGSHAVRKEPEGREAEKEGQEEVTQSASFDGTEEVAPVEGSGGPVVHGSTPTIGRPVA